MDAIIDNNKITSQDKKVGIKAASKTGKIIFLVVLYIFLSVLLLLSVLPFYYMIVASTRTTAELNVGTYWTFGTALKDNIKFLSDRNFDFLSGLRNSTLISVGATLLSVYISSLAAYALVLYRFKLNNAVFTLVLVLLMVPTQLSAVGFYQTITMLGLYDNIMAFILPAGVAPATIFFMRQYMKANVPIDYVESARIDSAGELRIFHQIVVPLTIPAVATMAIFAMIANWNNFFLPKIILMSPKTWTLPIMVDKLKGDIYRREVSALFTGLTLTTIPILIFYALLSKFIVKGVALGGIKE